MSASAPDRLMRLAQIGCDVVGVAPGSWGSAHLAGCASVIVVGNGGDALWEAFVAWVADDPRRLDLDHPLDRFVAAHLPADTPTERWIACSALSLVHLDFRGLALAAGLGHPSRLGLILHPRFGPWWGLRAACLTTEALPTTGPLAGAGPCVDCEAPCAAACPASAFASGPWDAQRCLTWQAATPTCASGCVSRVACPAGAEYRYGELQHTWHHTTALGRVRLAQHLGTRA